MSEPVVYKCEKCGKPIFHGHVVEDDAHKDNNGVPAHDDHFS
jgi:DNA-directed RNA polymerase subunit RPC12/RpoP